MPADLHLPSFASFAFASCKASTASSSCLRLLLACLPDKYEITLFVRLACLAGACQAEFGGIWGYNSRQLLAAPGTRCLARQWFRAFARFTEARTLGVSSGHACHGSASAVALSPSVWDQSVRLLAYTLCRPCLPSTRGIASEWRFSLMWFSTMAAWSRQSPVVVASWPVFAEQNV